MNSQSVFQAARKGVASNYARVALRLVLGLLTFRLLYRGLTAEAFGLWSLLWSVFGYGVLLDFGFGAAAQKRVAHSLATKDWDTLSRALSTILCLYTIVALLIAGAGYALSESLLRGIGVASESLGEYLFSTRLFFAGMAIGFPLGIFAEVLRGLQQTHVANRLAIASLIANAVLIALGIWLGWGLPVFFFIALACVLLPDLMAGVLALRSLPGVKLHPRHFSCAQLLETSRFSLFVWASTLSHLMRAKTDQLVIAVFLSLPGVALYQAAGKVAEMMTTVTRQVAEALTPAAAYFHASGETAQLRTIFLQGLRATVALATPLYVLAAVHLDVILWVLTGEAEVAPVVWATGQVLLFWCYQQTLTHLVFRRIFVMCGMERPLMWQSLAETVLNLALSIVFTLWWRSILGVAAGSAIPAVLFGWGVLWPWALRRTGLSGRALFRQALASPLLAGGCMLAVGLAVIRIGQPSTFLGHLLGLTLTGCTGALSSWYLVLSPDERRRLTSRMRGILGRVPASSTSRPESIS